MVLKNFGDHRHLVNRITGEVAYPVFFFNVGGCSRHIKPWRDMPTLLTRAGITTVETP